MAAWQGGYVSDVPYSLGFYKETTPAHMAFVAASLGKAAGGSLHPKRVLELGFGMGLGLALTAAANPETIFEGCDFNPEHVAYAQDLVSAAKLTNIELSDKSFQQIAAESREAQCDVDVIILHGIFAWVNTDARNAIVEIARKRLRPGGVLYVSYNCQPGWAPMAPIQRLLREAGKRAEGDSIAAVNAAISFVSNVAEEGGRYFALNPTVGQRLEKMKKLAKSYLAHEYLNEEWQLFHFADVARIFETAKLSYLGSATIAENMDTVSVPEALRTRVAAISDRIWKETLRDFASNKQFRRDIYSKGILSPTTQESNSFLDSFKFALAVPRSKVSFKIAGPLAEMEANPEMYGPLCDLLEKGVAGLSDVAALPVFAGPGRASALQALALLVHSGQVLPVAPGQQQDHAPGHSFNQAIALRVRAGHANNYLAAPVAGSGVSASNTQLVMLGEIYAGVEESEKPLCEATLRTLKAIGAKPMKDGQPIAEGAALNEYVSSEVQDFLTQTLPTWRKVGVV